MDFFLNLTQKICLKTSGMKTRTQRLYQPTATYTILREKEKKEPVLPTVNSRWRMRENIKHIKDQQMKNRIQINLPPQFQDFSISNTNVIQSNSQGIANKTAELMDLISKEKPNVFCTQ